MIYTIYLQYMDTNVEGRWSGGWGRIETFTTRCAEIFQRRSVQGWGSALPSAAYPLDFV